MTAEQIIAAWRNEDYRASLTEEQRANLPANPIEVAAATQDETVGAAGNSYYTGTCGPVCDELTPTYGCTISS